MITERVYKDRAYGPKTDGSISMFTGKEVEHTDAHGMQTLFVVGLQPVEEIEATAKKHNCEHIYFGANMSYSNPSRGWHPMIMHFLEKDYWVTLDADFTMYYKSFTDLGYQEFDKFISMISVKLPHIEKLNKKAYMKLDDIGFDETNSGVWVQNIKKMQDVNVYTDWSKYTEDEPI